MNFQTPAFLLLLLPVAAGVVVHFRKREFAKGRFVIVALALSLLIFALANPYWNFAPQPQIVKGVDLIFVVDVSQSMFCDDGSPRRIDQAKNFIRGMLPRFAGSSAGLIYFAKDAQIGIPMTPDLSAIQVFLDSIAPKTTEKPGTAAREISTAIEDLLKMDSGSAHKQKLILLFSDGEFQDDASPLVRVIAARADTTLMTFLCGNKKSPVPEYNLSGHHPGAFSTPDPARLKAAAISTGGTMYDLSRTTAVTLENELLNRARDIETQGKPSPDYQPYPFVISALFLLLAYQIAPATLHFLKRLLSVIKARRAVRLHTTGLVILGLFLIGMKSGNPVDEYQEAMKEISRKRYEQALRRLEAIKQKGASEEVDVAIGNIYFSQNQLDQAIRYYRSALLQNPSNSRARWNWEVALKKKQNPGPPPDQPPPSGQAPKEIPEETKSLLKYFDQLESDLMKQNNTKKTGHEKFEW